MITITHLSEAFRIATRAYITKHKGFTKYKGDATGICEQIIRRCWNGSYFQTSTGHFCQFYSRDFSWCVEALLKLGYREEVAKTLEYALSRFSAYKKVCVGITPSGRPFDFPYYAVDSLPSIIRSLRIAKLYDLVERYYPFIEQELTKFFRLVVDQPTGLVKQSKVFSSIKDHSIRQSSCYDNVMLGMLSSDLDKLKIENPLANYNYRKILKEHFWNGKAFIDSIGTDAITGDANVFPFWSGLFTSKKMLLSAINSIQDEGLDKPFPLRYSSTPRINRMLWLSSITKNYEGNTVWTHIGIIYIGLVRKINKKTAERYINEYKKLIEKFGTWVEVFNPDTTPYSSMFYFSDEGMLWAANFLDLIKNDDRIF